MASEWRIVVDTGVAISAALLPGSVPRQAVNAAVSRGRLLISEATTLELDDVFRRPKFDKYVRQETRLEFLAALVCDAELVEITEAIKACREADDSEVTRPVPICQPPFRFFAGTNSGRIIDLEL